MLSTLKEFFETRFPPAENNESTATATSLELAAAVLMVEISLADSSIHKDERNTIENSLESTFNLSREDARAIITLAEKEVDHIVSLHEFTSLLNKSLTPEEKIRIIELLWSVAFADKVLDKYEEYYVRKIADLLYVSHQDYIMAKHRMMKD